jgi:RimJ/RimL family protein N-acetyltransferase
MTYRIIGNQRQRGLDWAIPKLDAGVGHWDGASCLILERGGSITAVAVYNHYYPKNSVSISLAAIGGNWLNRAFLSTVFRIPFIEWEMRRVGADVSANNLKVIKGCQKLGFTLEGVVRDGVADGLDLLNFGMLKRECKFLGKFSYGAFKT